jgi:plastocyanin
VASGLRLIALSAVLVALLPPAIAAADDIDVLIADSLRPAELTVPPGTTITFVNQDADRHRMRSVSGPTEFDSGNLEQGETFSVTLTAEGTYDYVDDRDRDNAAYHGTITVGDTPPPDGGTPDPPPGEPPPQLSGDVSIVDRVYRPATIEVGVGATVSFVNNDDRAHTVTATDRSWDSGIFDTGGSYRRTFDAPGTFPYFCIIHPDMRGEVLVVSASGGPPPPPQPPPPVTTTTSTAPPAPPTGAGINIVDFEFDPATRTVAAGSTVTWTNQGAAPHTVAADDGSFGSGFLSTGDTYRKTFLSPGSFSYFCTLHPGMRGTVVVTGGTSGGEPAPPPSEPPPTGASPGPSPAGNSSRSGISIVDNAFSPRSRTITAGTTLVWTNDGALPHTVTARDASFDSGFLTPGGTFRQTFASPGVFGYLCTIHPGMAGTITVVGGSAAIASSPPPDPVAGVPATPLPEGSASITIIDNNFEPGTHDVSIGDVVTWVNAGELPHTVTAGDGSFDSGFLMTGEGYSITASSPGRIDYFCTIHPGMVGAINVGATDAVGAVGVSDAAAGSMTTSDPPAQEGDASRGEGVGVRIIDLDYEPRTLTIDVGTTVRWENEGALPHTVTATNAAYDSGIMAPGASYERTFDQAGTFSYLCTLHPGMVGVVEVEARASVVVAGAAPFNSSQPISAWVAALLAGTILMAMIAFVVGMNRFGRLAELER